MKVMIRKLTQTQMIVIGYALIILIGSLFLMLPAASRDGLATSFPDALFTATSASCVTGLVIADTFNKWTMFGQCIILALIQIGGLGFMTIGVFFAIILRRKIGLWMRGTLQESVNILQIGGIVRLAKKIMLGTLLFEGVSLPGTDGMGKGCLLWNLPLHFRILQCRIRSDGKRRPLCFVYRVL